MSGFRLFFALGGKRHYLSTGFADTATNRKLAEIKARQVELDIISGNFDPSLDKYRIAPLPSKQSKTDPAPVRKLLTRV
jgi:integrase